MNMLEVTNLVCGYTDLDILHGVNITVANSEIVSVIGPNGCGKSTLMKAIFGLLSPRQGSIVFIGKEIGGMRPDTIVTQGMSYVPQEREIFPSLTVQENLEMGAFIRKDSLEDSFNNLYEIFPMLRSKRTANAGTLSGGEKRMVGIARALMLSPKLLLLDEPSSGLSPKLTDVVFNTILEINRAGTAILMVEQNARKALKISHRGYVLDMGNNRFEGKGDCLLENPEILALYLGG